MGCEEFRDGMLDVLYGEAGGDAEAFDAHQRGCAECREELGALRRLRRDLGTWTVPAGAGVPAARAGASWLAIAATAVVALAAGLPLAGSDVRVDRGGVTVRIGRPEGDVMAALREQDARHRAELGALAARVDAAAQGTDMEAVRRLIRESEARQAVLFDAGLRGFAERTDAQRREDLAQVSAGLDYLEGRTGLQVARTTELMGHVLQASQRK
jgi:hypothetical protein